MTKKITSMFSRLAAQFLKPTLAILAALVVGGAWAAYDQIWTGETATDGKYYWSDNWKDGTGEWGNYVIGTETPNAVVNFTGEPNSATYLFLENNSKVLFQADSSTAGLETSGTLTIGTGVQPSELIISNGVYDVHGDIAIAATKAGSLTIADGAVVTCKGADDSVRWVVFGVWSESGTEGGTSDCSINLDAGGSLEAFHIHRYTTAGSCAVNFNGGTLKALGNTDDFITSTVTVTVGSNGGTIDVQDICPQTMLERRVKA